LTRLLISKCHKNAVTTGVWGILGYSAPQDSLVGLGGRFVARRGKEERGKRNGKKKREEGDEVPLPCLVFPHKILDTSFVLLNVMWFDTDQWR